MRKVILESPYAGDRRKHLRYARRAMHDCLLKGEAPLASHLLYTQPGVLNDAISDERQLGINAGFAWAMAADAVVFYADYGFSPGMLAALQHHTQLGHKVEVRYLFGAKRSAEPAIDPALTPVTSPLPAQGVASGPFPLLDSQPQPTPIDGHLSPPNPG